MGKRRGSQAKFTSIVHYIVWYFKVHMKRCHLGKIKLNKIMWLLDVATMREQGSSMSGERFYIKRENGPVTPRVLRALEELVKTGILDRYVTDNPDPDRLGYSIDLHAAQILSPPRREGGLLDDSERRLIRRICKSIGHWPAEKLSILSHDAVYDRYELGEQISLEEYLIGKSNRLTEEDRKWAEKEIDQYLESDQYIANHAAG